MRYFIFQVKQLRQHGLRARLKALVKKITRRAIAFVNSRSNLRIRCIKLTRWLGLYNSLRSIYLQFIRLNNDATTAPIHGTIQHLTPQARRIYVELKAAIANNQNTEGK